MAGLRGGVSRVPSQAAAVPARRVLGEARVGQTHRAQSAHDSFGKFLANWPADDQVGLLDVFARRGSRLGGFSGQYLLRFLGWDAFVLSGDVLLCLRDSGVPLSATGTSKKDLKAAQAQINTWAKESGLPITHVSRICALSIGENYDVARLKEIMQL